MKEVCSMRSWLRTSVVTWTTTCFTTRSMDTLGSRRLGLGVTLPFRFISGSKMQRSESSSLCSCWNTCNTCKQNLLHYSELFLQEFIKDIIKVLSVLGALYTVNQQSANSCNLYTRRSYHTFYRPHHHGLNSQTSDCHLASLQMNMCTCSVWINQFLLL